MNAVQAGLALLLFAGCHGAAQAQSYPARPVRILTAGAGTGPDSMSRMVAAEFSPALGQQVVVENRAAGFPLGYAVASAAPDGYTLLIWGGVFWQSTLFEQAPYDVVRDFAAIANLSRSPNVLVVNPAVPAKTVAELIKLAAARPGELNYSSGATGSASNIAVEQFKAMTHTNIVRISYKAGAQEVADLLSGQVQMTVGSIATWAPQIKSGKLRALATAGARRSLLFPDLPTVNDALPGYVSEQVLGFFAPARTPEAVVRRLNQEAGRMLDKPEVRERLLNTAQEPVGGTPEQLLDLVKADLAKVGKLIQDGVIKPGS